MNTQRRQLERDLRQNVPCVILSGGQSLRFGTNKALASVNGRRLIDQVISRLAAQTSGPIVINTPSRLGYDLDHHAFVCDSLEGEIGPLAGLHAALEWGETNGFSSLLTTPVDTPLLPVDFISRLIRSGASSIAKSDGRLHPLHGYWDVALRAPLEDAIRGGMRAAYDWMAFCKAKTCTFPVSDGFDPFFNINTKEDAAHYEKN